MCFLLLFVKNGLAAKNIDYEIREYVLGTDTGFINESMSLITHLGHGAVDYTIASLLPDEKARRDAQKALVVGGLSSLSLKIIIGQKRPPGPIEYRPFTFNSRYHAMPSGHTTTAFALAATISRHYPEYRHLSYFLAAMVGVSRLYEDKHWASNVVAGAGLGYVSAKLVEVRW